MEALANEKTYFVTRTPQSGGQHFLHSEYCAVLPEDPELAEVGTYEDGAAALARAREAKDPVNACAMCMPEHHVPDRAGGAHEHDTRAEADAALGEIDGD